MRVSGLIALILSVAALIGLAYTQNLYRETLRQLNELDKKVSALKNRAGERLQPQPSIPEQKVSYHSKNNQLIEDTINQEIQPANRETEKFYLMFKDALNRYQKEMREKDSVDSKQRYVQSRLKRYKKRLAINDIQWQFIEPILTEYLRKLDEIMGRSLLDHEADYDDYWQKLMAKQKELKSECAKRLSPYLTSQQIDNFNKIMRIQNE